MSDSTSEERAESPPDRIGKKETRSQSPRQKTIDLALYQAQRSLTSVAKDRRNEYSKYNYVSVDGMVSACRDALHENGLMVSRVSFTVDVERNTVVNNFVLVHAESGESRSYVTPWLFYAEKARPLDKAVAGALSTSLNYFLRDLLLVVREEEGSMDQRNDENYVPPRRDERKKTEHRKEYEGLVEELPPRAQLAALALSKDEKWRNQVWTRCGAELGTTITSWDQINDNQVDRLLKAFA